MKKCIFYLLLIVPLLTRSQQYIITIVNAGKLVFTDQAFEIPWSSVKATWPGIDIANIKITDRKTGKETMFQLEYHGQSEIVNLLVQVNLSPGSSITPLLAKGRHAPFSPKTYCRYVPERYPFGR